MPVNEIEDDVDDDDVFDNESDVEELRTSTSFSMITLEGDDRRRITFVSLLSLIDIVNNVDKYLRLLPIVWRLFTTPAATTFPLPPSARPHQRIAFVSFSLSFLIFSPTPSFLVQTSHTTQRGWKHTHGQVVEAGR